MNGKYIYYFESIIRMGIGFRNWPAVFGLFAGRARETGLTAVLRKPALRFQVRSAMDVWSIKETFLDRFYEKIGTPIRNGWTVVDIGAGLGDFSLFAAAGFPDNRVLAFEPFSDSLTLLEQNLRLNGIENVVARPEAIWSSTGQLTLDLSGQEPLQIAATEKGAREGGLQVPCLSLQDMFEAFGIGQCDLLKLDCEGAEYPILLEGQNEALKRVARIVLEYHNNVTSHTHRDLVKFLEKAGYQVRVQPNRVHDYLGYLYAERTG